MNNEQDGYNEIWECSQSGGRCKIPIVLTTGYQPMLITALTISYNNFANNFANNSTNYLAKYYAHYLWFKSGLIYILITNNKPKIFGGVK